MRFPLATLCHIWSACGVESRQAPTGIRWHMRVVLVSLRHTRSTCDAGGSRHGAGGGAGGPGTARGGREWRGRRGSGVGGGCGSPGGGGGAAAKPDRNNVEMAQLRGRTPDREDGAQGGLRRGSRNAETGDLPRFGRLRLSRGHSTIFRAGREPDTGRGEAARGSRFGKALPNECQWVMLTVSHGDAVRFGQANKTVPLRSRLPSPARTYPQARGYAGRGVSFAVARRQCSDT